MEVVLEPPIGGPHKIEVTTIGLDLSKNVFEVHGVDDEGSPRSIRVDLLGITQNLDKRHHVLFAIACIHSFLE